ncbi:hypothetical protein niasHT_012671 [Heterodera trifolii]|uniref:Uncharacterized protein n=1 Tax=Heterodera trifolii TaxID=157864 RepID=A0ABD2L1U1_9BILA
MSNQSISIAPGAVPPILHQNLLDNSTFKNYQINHNNHSPFLLLDEGSERDFAFTLSLFTFVLFNASPAPSARSLSFVRVIGELRAISLCERAHTHTHTPKPQQQQLIMKMTTKSSGERLATPAAEGSAVSASIDCFRHTKFM